MIDLGFPSNKKGILKEDFLSQHIESYLPPKKSDWPAFIGMMVFVAVLILMKIILG